MWSLVLLFSLTSYQLVTPACKKQERDTVYSPSVDEYWQEVNWQENVQKLNETNFNGFIHQRSWVFYYNTCEFTLRSKVDFGLFRNYIIPDYSYSFTWCPTFRVLRHSVAKIETLMRKNKYPGIVGAFECLGVKDDKPVSEYF